MLGAEMYLNKAEALCNLGCHDTGAFAEHLKTDMNRAYEVPETNHYEDALYDGASFEPDSWMPIMMLPMTEFDANPNMDSNKDQNP